jgi:hypothetical protein
MVLGPSISSLTDLSMRCIPFCWLDVMHYTGSYAERQRTIRLRNSGLVCVDYVLQTTRFDNQ